MRVRVIIQYFVLNRQTKTGYQQRLGLVRQLQSPSSGDRFAFCAATLCSAVLYDLPVAKDVQYMKGAHSDSYHVFV